ncbi:hypothetical protein [Halomonas salina]|uniref:hypothetical protein n=1 Tax=Halomonas salina TaxID=42565 RepID=UPI0012692C15|nr:hypothetical protein [Halomonas salina]
MASSKFLLVFLIIAAGYIFISSHTLTKGHVARTNGQHVYLKSALWGIAFFLLAIFIGTILPKVPTLSSALHYVPELFNGNLDPLTSTALIALELSVITLILLETPIKISNLIRPDSSFDRLLEKRFKYTLANKIMMTLEGGWLAIQLGSNMYAKWAERKSLGNNQVDLMVWDSLLSDSDVIMTCDDSGKVFIGFALQTPDPKQAQEVKAIKIVPIMSGTLCSEYQNLHITTDYSDNFSPFFDDALKSEDSEEQEELTRSNTAVVVYVKKIRYLRVFDIDMFENFFRRKVCACGNDIYQPQPQHHKLPIAISSKQS